MQPKHMLKKRWVLRKYLQLYAEFFFCFYVNEIFSSSFSFLNTGLNVAKKMFLKLFTVKPFKQKFMLKRPQ